MLSITSPTSRDRSESRALHPPMSLYSAVDRGGTGRAQPSRRSAGPDSLVECLLEKPVPQMRPPGPVARGGRRGASGRLSTIVRRPETRRTSLRCRLALLCDFSENFRKLMGRRPPDGTRSGCRPPDGTVASWGLRTVTVPVSSTQRGWHVVLPPMHSCALLWARPRPGRHRRRSADGPLGALPGERGLGEAVGGKVLAAHQPVQGTAVAPHHVGGVIAVDL